jgi:hypothetical protein
LPLAGISTDIQGGEQTTLVVVGKQAAAHVTHIVSRTRRITLRRGVELEIESADGIKTRVRCRPPKQ